MVEFRTAQRTGDFDVTQADENALVVGSSTSVPVSTLTTVATFTATVLIQNITRISCSGQESGKWQLFVDNILIETKRATPGLDVDFRWDKRFELTAASVLDVKVTHFYTAETPDFESTIYGF
jgi:hypothetical protein